MSKSNPRGYRGYIYPLPIDGYELIDVCFQIPDNPYYRAAVRGALHQLTYYYSWWNETSGADLQQRWDVGRIFLDLLEDTLSVGEGCAMQLQVRSNPLNPCVLEYSPDGGETWYTFANMLHCAAIAGDSYYTTLQLNLSQTSIYETIYDGTPGSINPAAPTGTWDEGGLPDRDAALCMAAMSLVGSIAAQEQQALTKRYIGSALIFAALFILTGGFAAFGILIVGTLIAGVSYNAAMAALGDRDALLAVACCMYDNLQGEAVTQLVFAGSLASCGFTPGSNNMIVRDFIDRSIQAQTTYLAMIDSAGKAYVQVTVLGINLCECGIDYLLYIDFTSNQFYEFIILPWRPDDNLGILTETIGNPLPSGRNDGWGKAPSGMWSSTVCVLVTLPTPKTIDRIQFDFKYWSSPNRPVARRVWLYDSLMNELDYYWSGSVGQNDMWHTQILNTDDPVDDVKYLRIFLGYDDTTQYLQCAMDNIKIIKT